MGPWFKQGILFNGNRQEMNGLLNIANILAWCHTAVKTSGNKDLAMYTYLLIRPNSFSIYLISLPSVPQCDCVLLVPFVSAKYFQPLTA